MKYILTIHFLIFKRLILLTVVVLLTACKLEVAVTPDAGGTVTSITGTGAPETAGGNRINCGESNTDCEISYSAEIPSDRQDTLTAVAASGYVFDGWYGGECLSTSINGSGTMATCDIEIETRWGGTIPMSIEARFTPTDLNLNDTVGLKLTHDFSSQALSVPYDVYNSYDDTTATFTVSSSNTDIVTVSHTVDTGNNKVDITLSSVSADVSAGTGLGTATITVEADTGSGVSVTTFDVSVGIDRVSFQCSETQSTDTFSTFDTGSPNYLNFESGLTRPLALSPDGQKLFAVNPSANCLEVFSVNENAASGKHLLKVSTLNVGMEPVAVAATSNSEVWVVNHLSDSVSIVDLNVKPRVVETLLVGDEPRDIVLASKDGNSSVNDRGRAFITTAHRGQNYPNPDMDSDRDANDFGFDNEEFLKSEQTVDDDHSDQIGRADVWVFDVASRSTVMTDPLNLFTHSARGLAVSADGQSVYAAGYFSGNQSSIVSEFTLTGEQLGAFNSTRFPDTGTDASPDKLLMGVNDDAAGMEAPTTGLIVKWCSTATNCDVSGAYASWRDETYFDGSSGNETGVDWTNKVPLRLPDRDLFVINANCVNDSDSQCISGETTSTGSGILATVSGVGTTLFNVVEHNGTVFVSNLEAHNEVRFESVMTGDFVDNRISVVTGLSSTPSVSVVNINGSSGSGSLALPGDMIVWEGLSGTSDDKMLVAAFGSAKVGVIDISALTGSGYTPSTANQITVDGGVAGLLLDESRDILFVYSRFTGKIQLFDVDSNDDGYFDAPSSLTALESDSLIDIEPSYVTTGRHFMYDATNASSNGNVACASCHVYGDLDLLAWDLGNYNNVIEAMPLRRSVQNIPRMISNNMAWDGVTDVTTFNSHSIPTVDYAVYVSHVTQALSNDGSTAPAWIDIANKKFLDYGSFDVDADSSHDYTYGYRVITKTNNGNGGDDAGWPEEDIYTNLDIDSGKELGWKLLNNAPATLSVGNKFTSGGSSGCSPLPTGETCYQVKSIGMPSSSSGIVYDSTSAGSDSDPMHAYVVTDGSSNGNVYGWYGFTIVPQFHFHPMKGPMTTQTFRGMKDSGALHWRGDMHDGLADTANMKTSFAYFNQAFQGLLGRSSVLNSTDLDKFTEFALSIMMPPNPVRELDNLLTGTSDDPLYVAHSTTDTSTLRDQQSGFDMFADNGTGDNTPEMLLFTATNDCQSCHAISESSKLFGTDKTATFESVGQNFKVPHVRNMYQKVGAFWELDSYDNPLDQVSGFGYSHDGSLASLLDFFLFFDISDIHCQIFSGTCNFANFDQTLKDATAGMTEFMMAAPSNLKPIVGQQITMGPDDFNNDLSVTKSECSSISEQNEKDMCNWVLPGSKYKLDRTTLMVQQAEAGNCDLLVSGFLEGEFVKTLITEGDSCDTWPDVVYFGGDCSNLYEAQKQKLLHEQEFTYTCLPPGTGAREYNIPGS